MAKTKAVVVGGGLAGLMATLKITEKNIPVDLISLVPVKRSHSVCAQGGVNAALDTKGEHDSIDQHFYDTVYGGDFLANQTPVRGLVENAPGLIYAMDRMGVMFTRTSEGLLDLRRFGGVKIIVPLLPALPLVSSCFTRWTSKFVIKRSWVWLINLKTGK